jgi:hypothetical protein
MPFKTFRTFGGIYDGDPDLALPDDASRIAVNARFTSLGLRQQYGFQRLVDTKAADSVGDKVIAALWDYMDGVDKHVLAVAGDRLLELSAWGTIPTTWSTVYTGLATSAGGGGLRTSFVTAFGRCYIQNGYMDPLVYDGPSGEVYEWGIAGPGAAPSAVAQNQVGIAGDTFGEFDADAGDFVDQFGLWTASTGHSGGKNSYSEGPIGLDPEGWLNVHKVRCDKSELTPFGVGTSLKVETGVSLENGWHAAGGGAGMPTYQAMKGYNGSYSVEFKHNGSGSGSYANWKWMRSASIWGTEIWNSIYHDRGTVTLSVGSTAVVGVGTLFTSDMVGMLFVHDGNAYEIAAVADTTNLTLDRNAVSAGAGDPYRISNTFFRLGGNTGQVLRFQDSAFFHVYWGAAGYPAATGKSSDWEMWRGPNDGELSRSIPIPIDGTNTTLSVACYARAFHEDVELEIRGNGNVPSFTVTKFSDFVGYDDGDWHRLEIAGHTFSAGEDQGEIIIRTKYDRAASASQQRSNLDTTGLVERTAWFDEVRITEGSTLPSEGGELNGHYKYRYSFYDEGDSTESNWSDASNTVEVKNGIAAVTLPEGPNGLVDPLVSGKWYNPSAGEHAVTHVRVCRAQSLDDGLTFGPYYVVLEKSLADIETEQILEPNDFPYTFDDTVAPTVAEENDICEGGVIEPPRGKFIVMYEGMMVVAGIYDPADPDSVPSDGRKLMYSEVNRPGVFKASNFLEIDTNDNDQITGLAVNQGRLWVFTKDSVYEVSALGDDFERVTKRHDGIGCVAGFGISSFEGVLFFPDRNGIYAMDSAGSLSRITKEVELAWKQGIDFDALQLAVLTDKKLWFNSLTFLWSYDVEQLDSQGKGKWSTMASGHRFWTIGFVDDGPDNKLLLADDVGYLYVLDDDYLRQGMNSGTLGGVVDSATINTLTDVGAAFYNTDDGLEHIYIRLRRISATGAGAGTEIHRIASNTADTITLDADDFWDDISGLSEGTVAVVNGSPTVLGTDSDWDATLVGEEFVVDGDTTSYTVLAYVSPTEITLDTNYGGVTDSGLGYSFPTPPDNNDSYIIATIDLIYWTKWHDFGEPSVKKLVKRIKCGVQNAISPFGDRADNISIGWQSRGEEGYSTASGYYGGITEDGEETLWISARVRGHLISFLIGGLGIDSRDALVYMMVELDGKDSHI